MNESIYAAIQALGGKIAALQAENEELQAENEELRKNRDMWRGYATFVSAGEEETDHVPGAAAAKSI